MNFLTLALLSASMVSAEIKAAPEKDIHADIFRNGDRWTAVGDSITQGGAYCAWIYLFYATRFPEMKIDVSNAGNSGDSADGGLIRYDWDIRPNKPTVATIMFGMNDVRREFYGEVQDTAELATRREEALQKYRRNMTALASRLKTDGTRIVFVTPSPYDETMKCKTPSLTGVNGALADCATFMRKLAGDIGASVIDLNGPMTALNAKMQAGNPESSLIKQDRVHPSELGHFAMAYYFLKGQQASGIVSSITVDAAASRVTESINATVDKLLVGDKGVSFTMTAKALPYPIGKELEPEMEKLKNSNIESDRWTLDWYKRYMETKQNEAQNLAKLAELTEQIRLAARPQPHSYQLLPVKK